MISPMLQGIKLLNASPVLLSYTLNLLSQNKNYFNNNNQNLKILLNDLSIIHSNGSLECNVDNLCTNSIKITPGSLYFAIKGSRFDGNKFIDEAIYRGAVAIITDQEISDKKVPVIQVEDCRVTLGTIAQRFYNYPDQSLNMIGITGTNGKTTVTYLVHHILNSASKKTGMIGTIKYALGNKSLPADHTTPEAIEIHKILSQIKSNNCTHAVMEVSSHGIDQARVNDINFNIAAFLNLTRDHIDYHKTFEEYFTVKSKLFTGETGHKPQNAVINIDDNYSDKLLDLIPNDVNLVTFGMTKAATIFGSDIKFSDNGVTFNVTWPDGNTTVMTSMLGKYNVSNILAALAICYTLGIDVSESVQYLKDFQGVPGRMEPVSAGQPYNVLVDYAHTDDALKNTLSMLREITAGKLIVIFGCGGNRDRKKRPLMTKAVQQYADLAWATSDNPRNESIASIFNDMKEGLTDSNRIIFEEDRRWAIKSAIDAAKSGDCILIAGKGHETYQEINSVVEPFDDRLIAHELIENKFSNNYEYV